MKRDAFFSVVLGLAVLLAWEVVVRVGHTSALVLPAPSVVALSLWQGLDSGYLWPHILHTLTEVVLGLLLGASMGFVGGVLLGESARLRGILMPYVVISQVVPKLALAPLFIVWFGFGMLPTVVMTALICFFPLLENTATCMQQVDANKLELFRMLRASPWQTLWRLKLPAGLPSIMAGLRVAVVLAWVGAVVGEFIGASRGLGALIIAAQGSMDTPLMFAVLTVITVLGLMFYKICEWLERRLLGTASTLSTKISS
ncbi:ABC transporter permease [Limnohabitans sp. B9-3]|uniref:ABC transporter permease n=1 Tax=Limnohabitans sp. B9-3 TaxID=1100707 RepID=UPI000C1DD3A5|nr:ABC transporter permease [Limnohabitans sp. B9-3]PIT73644.1 ABC transporter permease [Limnohabitans sp. B9-3]